MASLVSLSSSFFYGEYTSVTGECNDLLGYLRTELTVRNMPVWTEVSTNLYKSPVDGAGRFMDLLFTRIDGSTIEMRVRDQIGRTVCTRRMQFGGVTIWRIYSGQFHFEAAGMTSGGWATLYAGIVDQSPDAQGSYQYYVYGGGYLNTSNVADGNSDPWKCYMLDNGSLAVAQRLSIFSSGTNSNATLYSLNGSRIYKPAEMFFKVDGSYYRIVGRRYQYLVCDSGMQFPSRVTIPIDNISATFHVSATGSSYNHRLLVRAA